MQAINLINQFLKKTHQTFSLADNLYCYNLSVARRSGYKKPDEPKLYYFDSILSTGFDRFFLEFDEDRAIRNQSQVPALRGPMTVASN